MSDEFVEVGTILRVGNRDAAVIDINVYRRQDTGVWDTMIVVQLHATSSVGGTITQVPMSELVASIDKGKIKVLPPDSDESEGAKE